MQMIEIFPSPRKNVRLVGYLHDTITQQEPHRTKRPAVLVCPGGAYEFCSQREADPVAFVFFEKGYQVFVLYYSLEENACDMNPLSDLSLSMITLRENAEKWNIETEHIAVCGFSAGGHLAASLGTLWDHPRLKEKIDTKNGLNRPNALILAYPVITAGEYAHKDSLEHVSGYPAGTPENDFWALETHVSEKTPPVYIWHTVDDELVPVENTLFFINALQKSHVSFECHIYPHGKHGKSVCTEEVNTKDLHIGSWVPLCIEWLNELFHFSY